MATSPTAWMGSCARPAIWPARSPAPSTQRSRLQATTEDAPRKYFSLSAAYADWRDYSTDPRGFGLHGLEIPPGEVIRLTQAEVEAHPAWQGFGDQADAHPPMRGWLATAVCGEGATATAWCSSPTSPRAPSSAPRTRSRSGSWRRSSAPRSTPSGSRTPAPLRSALSRLLSL
jgi:hypothetical protein